MNVDFFKYVQELESLLEDYKKIELPKGHYWVALERAIGRLRATYDTNKKQGKGTVERLRKALEFIERNSRTAEAPYLTENPEHYIDGYNGVAKAALEEFKHEPGFVLRRYCPICGSVALTIADSPLRFCPNVGCQYMFEFD